MTGKLLAWQIKSLVFVALALISTAVQAQTCQTCNGASQYYHGRTTLATQCCPTCQTANMCCCQGCMSPSGAAPAMPAPSFSSPSVNLGDQMAPTLQGMPVQPGMVQPRMPMQPRTFPSTQMDPRSFGAAPSTPMDPRSFGSAPSFDGAMAPSTGAPMGQPAMGAPSAGGMGGGIDPGAAAAIGAGVGAAAAAGNGGGGAAAGAGTGAAAAAGTSQLASGSGSTDAPPMIGDFLNGATGSTVFSARVLFELPGVSVATIPPAAGPFTAANFINGFDSDGGPAPSPGPLFGDATLLDDLEVFGLSAGETGFFDTSGLAEPLNSYFVQSASTPAETAAAVANGGTVLAAEPVSRDEFVGLIQQGIEQEGIDIAEDLGDLANFVSLEFVPEESYLNIINNPDGGAFGYEADYVYRASLLLPTVNPGEVIGRATFTDNNSPIPRDRIFFDFNYFNNARIGSAEIPMTRFVPGFEKTFRQGLMSFEMRLPMAVTLNSTIVEGTDEVLNYEIGDLAMALKAVLHHDKIRTVTTGIGVSVPTADDFVLQTADETTVLSIENQTVRLMPYVAALIQPNDRIFMQAFISADVGANGNQVGFDEGALNAVVDGTSGMLGSTGLADLGTLNGATLGKVDLSVGRWLFRNRTNRRLTGLATVMEAHYVATLNEGDAVEGDGITIGRIDTAEVLNLTAGMHFHMGTNNVLTVGYGAPVTEERFFDGELRAMFNRYF